MKNCFFKNYFWKKLTFFLLVLFFLKPVLAVISSASIPIFAVSDNGNGLQAWLNITIVPGTGKVWSSVNGPLVGTTTQNTEKIAVKIAKKYFKDVNKYDYKFDINSTASVVEGPSAGAAMALLVISMLTDKKLPENVAITGTIIDDGSIGPVGGVFSKAKEAAESDIKLFMIPKGESLQTYRFPNGIKTVNLPDYALKEWGLKVVEVSNIDEVLKFAFMPVESIDINKVNEETLPIFTPPKISINKKLSDFKPVSKKLLERAKKEISRAKQAIETTGIDSTIIINALYGSLNSSEKSLDEADLLLENNYFYSGANLTFLSIVNAMLVRDLSENPSLMEPNSFWLENEIEKVESNLKKLEKEVSLFYSFENFEWSISARERLVWAEMALEKVKNQPNVIIIGGTKEDQIAASIDRLRQFEFAKAWYEVAYQFNELAKKNSRKIVPDSIFKKKAEEFFIETQNIVSAYPENISEDIKRRFDASKREKEKKWFVAMAVDAISAKALLEAEKAIKDKSYEELITILEKKIRETKQKIKASKRDYIWSQLYLDHANYYLESARFYHAKGFTIRAIENAKAGVSLSSLADNIYDVINLALNELEAKPRTDTNIEDLNITPKENIIEELNFNKNAVYRAVIVAIILITGIFLVVFLIVLSKKTKTEGKEIKKLEKEQRMLLDTYSKGKISEKQFLELKEELEEKLKRKNYLLNEKSRHLIRIDSLHQEISALNNFIAKIKEHYLHEEITFTAYKEAMLTCKHRLSSLTKRLEKEVRELEETELKLSTFETQKNKTQKSLPEKTPKKIQQKNSVKKRVKKLKTNKNIKASSKKSLQKETEKKKSSQNSIEKQKNK